MSSVPKFAKQILTIMKNAKRQLTKLSHGGDVIKQGETFGDLVNDTDIRADRVLGLFFQTELAKIPGVARISVEGLDDLNLQKEGMLICVDPIDGSLNYKLRGRLIGNPYTAVVTVFSTVDRPVFGDAVFAAILDLRPRSLDLFCAWQACDGSLHAQLNGKSMSTSRETKLDPGSQIIMTETYYPLNRQHLVQLFEGQKGNFSRLGSAAYEMALVSSGTATVFICISQKNHELGATQLLVRAAGGVAVDWDGNSIESRSYDFRAQTRIILAANQQIATEICSRIQVLSL